MAWERVSRASSLFPWRRSSRAGPRDWRRASRGRPWALGRSSVRSSRRGPNSSPNSSSSFSRRWRARAGLRPLVEMARMRPPRRTTEGTMKLHSWGLSTTFTSRPLSPASRATWAFTSRLDAAEITRVAPSRSWPWYSLGTSSTTPSLPRASSLGVKRGATTLTRAPASRRETAFLSATTPPPTPTQGRPPLPGGGVGHGKKAVLPVGIGGALVAVAHLGEGGKVPPHRPHLSLRDGPAAEGIGGTAHLAVPEEGGVAAHGPPLLEPPGLGQERPFLQALPFGQGSEGLLLQGQVLLECPHCPFSLLRKAEGPDRVPRLHGQGLAGGGEEEAYLEDLY